MFAGLVVYSHGWCKGRGHSIWEPYFTKFHMNISIGPEVFDAYNSEVPSDWHPTSKLTNLQSSHGRWPSTDTRYGNAAILVFATRRLHSYRNSTYRRTWETSPANKHRKWSLKQIWMQWHELHPRITTVSFVPKWNTRGDFRVLQQ